MIWFGFVFLHSKFCQIKKVNKNGKAIKTLAYNNNWIYKKGKK